MSKQKETCMPTSINEETDIFLNYLEKRKRNLKKKLNEIGELKQKDNLNQEQGEKVNQEANVYQEIEQLAKMKDHYIISHQKAQNQSTEVICSKNSENLLSVSLRNQKKEILEFISDTLFFSRLAYQNRIESEYLANLFREHFLGEKKILEETTYGQEKQLMEQQLKEIFDQDSLFRQELKKIDRQILKERIQPQILELDEDFEDDNKDNSSNIIRDDQDEEEKEQVGSMDEALKQHPTFYQMHSQNYDGDSEKSHTENEINIKVKQDEQQQSQESIQLISNQTQSQPSKNQQGNRNYFGNNYNGKYFRRYKQNRYREERFAYVRRNKNTTNSNQSEVSNKDPKVLNNNEYESDVPFQNQKQNSAEEKYFSHHHHINTNDHVSCEDNNIKSNHSDNQVQSKNHSSQNANSSNNNLNYNSNTSFNQHNDSYQQNHTKHYNKKPYNSNNRRQNPYRKNNDYDTDREKEQKDGYGYNKK
ncbi:hypothetical protein ABPG72_021274 [Tetrahymena utriculariae]